MAPAVGPKYHVQQSIQANKEHQAALKTYTERLETELEELDKLLVATSTYPGSFFSRADASLLQGAAEVNDDEEPDLEVGGYVSVPGSTRAAAPISMNELLNEVCPVLKSWGVFTYKELGCRSLRFLKMRKGDRDTLISRGTTQVRVYVSSGSRSR